MVEGAQALAQLDVDAAVPQRTLHNVVRCPLVAGRHLAGVGWAALAPGRAAVSAAGKKYSLSELYFVTMEVRIIFSLCSEAY